MIKQFREIIDLIMIDNDLVEIEADLVLLSVMRSVYIEKRQKNSISNKLGSFNSDLITNTFDLPTVKIKGFVQN